MTEFRCREELRSGCVIEVNGEHGTLCVSVSVRTTATSSHMSEGLAKIATAFADAENMPYGLMIRILARDRSSIRDHRFRRYLFKRPISDDAYTARFGRSLTAGTSRSPPPP